MKSRIIFTLLVAIMGLNLRAADAKLHPPDEVLPMIKMEEVPLREAVKALAHQAGLNCILDPDVIASFISDNERGIVDREPQISFVWTNVTAPTALKELLTAHQLITIMNPVTGVARIGRRGEDFKPVSPEALGNDSGAIIPLIKMDAVPLRDAIQALARQANVAYVLDPAVDLQKAVPGSRCGYTIDIRWENLTAKKALVAVLDNYGLQLVETPGESSAKIVNRPLELSGPPDGSAGGRGFGGRFGAGSGSGQ